MYQARKQKVRVRMTKAGMPVEIIHENYEGISQIHLGIIPSRTVVQIFQQKIKTRNKTK
jgi:hypothetical protein